MDSFSDQVILRSVNLEASEQFGIFEFSLNLTLKTTENTDVYRNLFLASLSVIWLML